MGNEGAQRPVGKGGGCDSVRRWQRSGEAWATGALAGTRVEVAAARGKGGVLLGENVVEAQSIQWVCVMV